MRISLNIDHVATLRQQRKETYPSPVDIAVLAQRAGIYGITAHLREDRRHTQDEDIFLLRKIARRLNLEMALTREMVKIALKVVPDQVTFVPEKREELTTEGGLDILKYSKGLKDAVVAFHKKNIDVSFFVEPDHQQIQASKKIGADIVEIHTGNYATACIFKKYEKVKQDLLRINEAIFYADKIGLRVHIGHGLTLDNIEPFRDNRIIEEASIGHFLIGLSIYMGIEKAIKIFKKGSI